MVTDKSTHNGAIAQYSCVTCRSRKIKCNKLSTGCDWCKKTGVQCVYLLRRTQRTRKIQASVIRPLAPAEPAGSRYPTPPATETSLSTPLERGLGFLFSNNENENLQGHHPSFVVSTLLWQYYVENVDILVKILHKPTVEPIFTHATKDLENIDTGIEALIFAIYFAAVTTMSDDECLRVHKEEKNKLLQKYQYALEQSLEQAGLMTTQDIVVLQALVLLIACAPRKSARSTWMLSGMALRIAQTMGLHQESTFESLNTVETETRRRIWWTLCIIDNRVSVDCGLETNVPITMDTKIPCLINDSDFGNTEAPVPNIGFTEMTASVIKIELVEVLLKRKHSEYAKSSLDVKEMERLIQEKTYRFETVYLKGLDSSLHLHQMIALGARLILLKLWRVINDLHLQNNPPPSEREEIKKRLRLYNTQVLEIANEMPDKSAKFGWFFQCKYYQWHAITYLLIELSNQLEGPEADRAWKSIDALFSDSGDAKGTLYLSGIQEMEKSTLWARLQKLLKRARQVRLGIVSQYQPKDLVIGFSSFTDHSSMPSNGSNKESIQAAQDTSLLGDPFLGTVEDFSEEMNWESWTTQLRDIQDDIIQQDGYVVYQGSELIFAPNLWP
ncbi:fungal-specific transcription factor domain-containing protein [Bisporella sp. PMI_857]|nr:fungal-specific transcription factor domain-containing protein [Bisporella sp. PMI_857]